MIKLHTNISLVLLVILLTAKVSFSQIQFYKGTYEEAVAEAKTSGKMLFVDFRANWCKPCIQMERTTFQNQELGNYVNKKFISLKADIDSLFYAMDLKEKHNVNQYPSILVIDPNDDQVYLRMIGFKTADILMGDLKSIEHYLPSNHDDEIITNKEIPEKKQSNEKKSTRKKCRIFSRRK